MMRFAAYYRAVVVAALMTLVGFGFASRAGAQPGPGPLPTAPGADRAVEGGLSQAHASLPGGPGRSPLEPYLVLWLLPVSGLLTIAAAFYVDRRVLALARRRR